MPVPGTRLFRLFQSTSVIETILWMKIELQNNVCKIYIRPENCPYVTHTFISYSYCAQCMLHS